MKDYFRRARHEILPYLPKRIDKILDVGCGEGATSALIKNSYPSINWMGGIELSVSAAQEAEKTLDKVWCASIEDLIIENEIPKASLDVILCLDVLEHLADPWDFVKKISPLLANEGRLIVSIPNIRNWKFIKNLLFRGDFRYREAGLLDKTHLRFFVRETAIELSEIGGLSVSYCGNAHQWKIFDFRNILSMLTMKKIDDLLIKQFVIVASPKKHI